MEALTAREKQVLDLIMNNYIVSAEPVGSGTLSARVNGKWSSATIRNVMADLEEQGFLYKPHVVAGRIPTGKAFRYYVNTLLVPGLPGKREMHALAGLASHRYSHVEEIMGDASRMLANLCQYTGIVVEPKINYMLFKEVEFVKLSKNTILVLFVTSAGMVHTRLVNTDEDLPPELLAGMKGYMNEKCEGVPFYDLRKQIFADMARDREAFHELMGKVMDVLEGIMQGEGSREVYLEGTFKFIGVPELSDITRLKDLFQAFEKKGKLLRLLDKSVDQDGINVIIGAETEVREMRDMSIITSPYGADRENQGVLGVIGPLRMNYSRIIPIVHYTAQAVTNLLRIM